jgi:hypothetical protein
MSESLMEMDEMPNIRSLVTAGVMYLLVRRVLGGCIAPAPPPPPPPQPAPQPPLLGWSLMAGPAFDLPPGLWADTGEAKMFGRVDFLRRAGRALGTTLLLVLGVYASGAALQYACDMLLVAANGPGVLARPVPETAETTGSSSIPSPEGPVSGSGSGSGTNPLPIGAANRNHLVPAIEDVVRHYHQFIARGGAGGDPLSLVLAGALADPSSADSPAPPALIVQAGYPGAPFLSWRYWCPSDGMCASIVGLVMGLAVYLFFLSRTCEWTALARFRMGHERSRRIHGD